MVRPVLLAILFSAVLLNSGCQSTMRESEADVGGLAGLFNSRQGAADALQKLLVRRAELLDTTPGSPEETAAIAAYNRQATRFVDRFEDYLDEGGETGNGMVLTSSDGQLYQLGFPDRDDNEQLHAGRTLASLMLASQIDVDAGTWGERASREGVGVPLVVEFEPAPGDPEVNFHPPGGLALPITAVFDLPSPPAPQPPPSADPAVQPVEVRLHDPYRSNLASLGDRDFPLAVDTTAPLPDALDPGVIHGLGLAGLFRPAQGLDSRGLYELQPADPDRVPVIFIHGLNSNPAIWRRNINAVLADPVLSRQYQPLFFAYPTGLPIPGSAAALREQFAEWREVCDPEGDDIASQHAIFVGHSMGGLLSRMQVIDSGDFFWRAFFVRTPEEVDMIEDNTLDEVRRALFFDSTPGVDAAIFLATPHRGSDIATFSIVKWVLKLVQLPGTALRLVQFGADHPGEVLFNPRLRKFRRFGLDSVTQLEPDHPYFDALAEPEIEVPHHSVIGVVQHNRPLEETSDRVVPYLSSHLDTAATEDYVHHWHNLTSEPRSVELVNNLLLEYAEMLPDAD